MGICKKMCIMYRERESLICVNLVFSSKQRLIDLKESTGTARRKCTGRHKLAFVTQVQKRKVPEATGWEVLCVKGSYNYLGALTRPPLQKFPKAFALENYRSIVVPLLIKLVDCIVITT